MKKQILISSIIATSILGGTGLIILNNANAEEKSTTENNPLIATTTSLTNSKPINTSKNETVYVMTDEAGSTKSKFIGSTIYDGAEELPFNFIVTYYLDGQEINGKDLKGKSGHVKIVYHYNSTATYQGKYIPFLGITGLTLDHANFNNVKVENGKIISENADSYIITGYGIAGANQDLNIDILPDTFTLEADVTDFKLENTYTIFTNDLLSDLDTSKLNTLDDLTNSVYQLEDGINKILNGATDLSNGLSSALDGTQKLYAGSQTLASGTKDAAAGGKALSDGLNTIVSNNETLQGGANQVISSLLQKANQALNLLRSLGAPIEFEGQITVSNYQAVYEAVMGKIEIYRAYIRGLLNGVEIPAERLGVITTLLDKTIDDFSSLKSLIDLNLGVINYTDGVAKAAAGATDLSDGLTKLYNGASELSNGLGNLVEGETKLYEGSVTLKNGLETFKTSGIDKLVNFASKDLTNFTRNARSTINAAASYRSFGNVDAKSVKFIVKTPSI